MNKILHSCLAVMCLAFALMLTGCGSTKKAVVSDTDKTVFTDIDMHKAQAQRIQCKMQMALRTDDHHYTVGGNIKMERGSIVQLSIMPFGLVEMGLIEFTPEYVLMVYRTGHQFVKVRYKDIDLLAKNGINFNAIEALFWGELFAPGKSSYNMDDFTSTPSGNDIVLASTTGKDIVARFVTSRNGGVLRHTQVTSTKPTISTAVFNWKYQDYMRVGRGELPSQFELSIDNIDRPVSCRFTLSNLKTNPSWNGSINTVIDKDRYQEVPFNTILTRLLNF